MEQHTYREQFELEDEHWWFEGRRAVIWSLLARAGIARGAVRAGVHPGLRVLDAGCGTGRNLLEFGRFGTAAGIDVAPEAVEFCRRRGLADVRQGAVEQLPFEDDSFDLVLATDVLEHVEDDLVALRELRRVAAPGGRLLATVPAYRWLWSQHDHAYHHFRRYTLGRLRTAVSAGGWEPVAWSYFNSVLLVPIAAVRVLARRHPVEEGRPDLRLTPRALNGVLLAPMRAEAALIRRGVRLPAGVSIGMVCAAA